MGGVEKQGREVKERYVWGGVGVWFTRESKWTAMGADLLFAVSHYGQPTS